MAIKLTDLAKELSLPTKDLREKLKELGHTVRITTRSIEDNVADELRNSMKRTIPDVAVQETKPSSSEESEDIILNDDAPEDTAGIYGEIIDEELDREIIKQQRKQTAGQVTSKKDRHAQQQGPKKEGPKTGVIEIPEIITVKEFSEKTGINPVKIIGELMKNGILASINQQIDFDTASIIAGDLGVQIKKKRSTIGLADVSHGNLEAILKGEEAEDLKPRPPIVVVMGHVDHGKTKLLDSIRHTNVVDKESGGITQHIAAYQVEKNGKKITFLDTPGHEAFTAMRARGAKVTDIAILVVAADEGMMPQTIEALNHAKEAEVPIIVALNKIDKPHIQIDRVKGQLAEHGLQPEEWGGNTPIVPVSALTGQGIPELLDMILLVSEMEYLKANPNREAIATVIEAHLDKSMGPIATVIVNAGTMHIMDNVVIGASFGRIKSLKDQNGKNVDSAPPSMPVVIAGLSETPISGDILQVVHGDKTARHRALQIQALREQEKKLQAGAGLNDIIAQINTGSLKNLKIVLKADTQGTLEAIKSTLLQIKHPDVAIKIIHSAVGAVTESDVMMAAASKGLVIGFHVTASPHIMKAAERSNVEILIYTIIYQLTEDLKNLLSGLLEPELVETILGKMEAKQIFFRKKGEQIVGCSVTNGKVEAKSKLRVFRAGKQVGEGIVDSLKKFENQVKEVGEGNDCGIKFVGNVDLEPGDVLEAYKIERKKRTL